MIERISRKVWIRPSQKKENLTVVDARRGEQPSLRSLCGLGSVKTIRRAHIEIAEAAHSPDTVATIGSQIGRMWADRADVTQTRYRAFMQSSNAVVKSAKISPICRSTCCNHIASSGVQATDETHYRPAETPASARARCTAANASISPDPVLTSRPGVSRSRAVSSRIRFTRHAASDGLAERMSAATPAPCGPLNEFP